MTTERETVAMAPSEPRPILTVGARLVLGGGLFVFLFVAGLAGGAALALWTRQLDFLRVGPALGLGAGALALAALAVHDLFAALELITGRDLDGSGAIGDGLVLLRSNGARGGADADAQLQAAFADFVRGCALDTSARRWEPEIGRGQYQRWRRQLLDAGWARWRSTDERAGWELTAPAAEILAALG